MSSSKSAGGQFVVAIDFGTTFSGHASVRKAGQDTISRFFEWPGVNTFPGRHYCKTITALYYVGDEQGKYQLDSWGWPALDNFTSAMKLAKKAGIEIWSTSCGVTCFKLADGLQRSQSCRRPAGTSPSYHASSSFPVGSSHGCYVTQFKLDLIKPSSQRLHLPGDLNTERLIVDYLKSLADFIMIKLRSAYDNHLRNEDVEWCLTVPSIWDVQAKQRMIACAEKAGLGNLMQGELRSSTPLDIILEPEGASLYCQLQVSKGKMLRKGDNMMIVDVGGGTIDLVVHSKAENNVSSTKVDEVVSSYGELGGGTFVDAGFFSLLSEKIGRSFEEVCWQEPGTRLKISEWWQGVKKGFNQNYYSVSLDIRGISSRLHAAWREEQIQRFGPDCVSSLEDDEMWLENEDFRCIFDPEVNKVINLINMQVGRQHLVKVLMVVGGFSTSPYLRYRIHEKFAGVVSQILFPEEPGSAISYGAVQLHLHNSIQSRIAQRTYGISTVRKKEAEDPQELVYTDGGTKAEMCKEVFHVFVQKGKQIPCGHSVSKDFAPGYADQKAMQVDLYSTEDMSPRYTTACKHEGGFEFDIKEGLKLKKRREIQVQMVFGASSIHVTTVPKNFGSKALCRDATFIAPLDW